MADIDLDVGIDIDEAQKELLRLAESTRQLEAEFRRLSKSQKAEDKKAADAILNNIVKQKNAHRELSARVKTAFKEQEKAADKAAKEMSNDVERAAEESATAWDQASAEIGKRFSFMDLTAASFVGNLAARFAELGIQAVTNGFRNLFNTFVTEGVQAAQVQEDAINQLNTSLALSGRFSEETSDELQSFARSLQQASTVGDEVILTQLALANNFAKNTDQAKDLTQAALDLSAATNLSLDSALTNLGKTTGGLVGELGEVIPELKNLTKEELAAGKAIEFVLERFGGAAAAQVQTFSGALAQASNSFGDLQETIGFVFTESKAIVELIQIFNQVFVDLQSQVKQNEGALREFAVNGILFGVRAFQFLLEAVDLAQLAFNGLKIVFAGVSIVLAEFVNLVIKAARGWLELADLLGLDVAGDAAQSLRALEDELRQFSEIQQEIAAEESKNAAETQRRNRERIDAVNNLGNEIKRVAREAADEQVIQNQKVKKSTEDLSEAQKKVIREGQAVVEAVAAARIGDKLDQDIKKLEDALKQQLKNREDFEAALLELEQQRFERDLEKESEMESKAAEQLEKDIAALEERHMLLSEVDAEAHKQEIERLDQLLKVKRGMREKDGIADLKFQKKLIDFQKKQDADKVKDREATGQKIATLQNSNNKTLAAAGKAAALTIIALEAPKGVSRALGAFPPPFNFVAAALVGAAFAAQAAKVAGVQLQDGLTEVPSGFPRDSFPAALTSGERVVSAPQNQDLSGFLRDNSENNALLMSINQRLQNLEMSVTVNIGSRQIVNEVNRATDEGFVLDV